MENIVRIISDIRLNDRPPYTCLICDQIISNIYQLREHYYYDDHINSNSSLVENDRNDDTNFNQSDELESGAEIIQKKNKSKQKRMSKGKGEFECPVCNKYFAQKSSRARHIREQHENPEKLPCDLCELRFCNKFNLQTHQRRAHSKILETSNSAFKCPHCPRAYGTKIALTRHKNGQHKNHIQSEKLPTESSVQCVLNKTEENDPQSLAESVLKELKQLQKAIENTELGNQSPKSTENSNQSTAQKTSIDDAIVEEVIIKDSLFPSKNATEYKVQQIKRSDGFCYYVCEFCSKEFRKSYNYLCHRRVHTKLRPFICVLCKKAFPTQTQLKRHCSTRHRALKKNCLKCPKCLEGFASIALFDKHLSSHLPHSFITFNCKQCPKTFKSLKLYFAHNHKEFDPELDMLKTLLPSPICVVEDGQTGQVSDQKVMGEFQCSICDVELSSSVGLKQHEKRHQTLWKYQCNICKGFYASKSSLKVHTKFHLNVRNFKCKECSKMFHTKFQLNRHQLIRHGTAEKNYKCRYCDKHFKTAQYCRSHMMTHIKQLIQKPNETITAEECNVTTVQTIVENTDKGQLIIQELEIPKKPKRKVKDAKTKDKNLQLPYKCSNCPQSFRYNAWLKKHMAESHSNERAYKCHVCLKGFRKNQILEKHLLIHNKERITFTCQVCGKQYATNKSLKVHLRIHTQDKPFECKLCSKFFRTSGHLKAHHKSNHHHKV